jgi:hypothetical protein
MPSDGAGSNRELLAPVPAELYVRLPFELLAT